MKELYLFCPFKLILSIFSSYLESYIKTASVFEKTNAKKALKNVEEFANEKGFSLNQKTQKMKEREKKIVSKSFHGVGIVVPVDKKTDVGYREIPESTGKLIST